MRQITRNHKRAAAEQLQSSWPEGFRSSVGRGNIILCHPPRRKVETLLVEMIDRNSIIKERQKTKKTRRGGRRGHKRHSNIK